MRIQDRLRALVPDLERLFPAAQPTVAASIDDERVVMARVAAGGSGPKLLGWFAAPAPQREPGAGHDAKALAPLLAAAKQAVAPGGGPVSLVLPDSLVRVAIIAAAQLPRGREERRDVVAWRLKKILPYRMEEALVDSQVFPGPGGQHVVVAAAVRRKTVAEQEALLAAHGFEVGSVTASTLALASALPRHLSGDALLLHVSTASFAMFVTNGREPVLFRSKSLPAADRSPDARDAAVVQEIAPTVEYLAARLSRPRLSRLFVHAADGLDDLLDRVAGAVDLAPERLPPGPWSAAPAEVAGALAPACAQAALGLSNGAAGEAA